MAWCSCGGPAIELVNKERWVPGPADRARLGRARAARSLARRWAALTGSCGGRAEGSPPRAEAGRCVGVGTGRAPQRRGPG